jgi:hypothetical protein
MLPPPPHPTTTAQPHQLAATPAPTRLAARSLSPATPVSAQLAPAPSLLTLLPAELRPLARDLQRYGFQLRLAPPPAAGAYGQYVPASRSLWVAPIAFDLGIGRPTFLHEAVHAVQSCPGGRLTPIGWKLRLKPVVSQEIGGILTTRYHHGNRLLEQEAFGLQGQPDAVARISAALHARCRRSG